MAAPCKVMFALQKAANESESWVLARRLHSHKRLKSALGCCPPFFFSPPSRSSCEKFKMPDPITWNGRGQTRLRLKSGGEYITLASWGHYPVYCHLYRFFFFFNAWDWLIIGSVCSSFEILNVSRGRKCLCTCNDPGSFPKKYMTIRPTVLKSIIFQIRGREKKNN